MFTTAPRAEQGNDLSPLSVRDQTLNTLHSGSCYLTKSGVLIASLLCVMWLLNAMCAHLEYTGVSIVGAALLSVASLLLLKHILHYWNSIILLFWITHTLYGISGPFSWYFSIEGLPLIEHINFGNVYIILYSLSSFSFILGIFIIQKSKNSSIKNLYKCNYAAISLCALFFAAIAATIEVNSIRQIGLSEISGKGAYHLQASQIDPLSVGTTLGLLSCAFIAFLLGNPLAPLSFRRNSLLAWILVISPVLVSSLLIGKRGFIVSTVLCYLILSHVYRKIEKIKISLITNLIFLYLFGVLIFITRGTIVQIAGGQLSWDTLTDTVVERTMSFLNPAAIEFGAPFVNFNLFYSMVDKIELRYGETYIRGLTSILEYILYGRRSPSISEEFNIMFFSQDVSRGIGWGFSSLVEAYWNFGIAGTIVVYFLFARALFVLENKVKNSSFSPLHLIYALLIPVVILFHRSNFGLTFWLFPIILGTIAFSLYMLLGSILARR